MTQIIEKNIKIEYLKKYCKQLQDSIQHEEDTMWMHNYEERKEFDNSDRGKEVARISTAIYYIRTRVEELQTELLNTVLEENGFEKIEGPLR